MRRLLSAVLILATLVFPASAAAANHRVGVLEPPTNELAWTFTPGEVTAQVGDTVDFVNDGKVIHSFVADDNSFNSGVIDPGRTFSQTFRRAGRVPYLCDIHPQMRGVINVVAPAAPTGPGEFFPETGFSVSDENGVRFLSEFRRLGGVQAVGYPASRRFQWEGFTVQVFQRVIFQWRPDLGGVAFVNVFDRLNALGKDQWLLQAKQTPLHAVPAEPLSALEGWPAIRAKYYSVADPTAFNGLPTSQVQDMGNHYALRAQRVVFQQWKEDVPWARRGEVTVALGGDIAKEAGVLPDQGALVRER